MLRKRYDWKLKDREIRLGERTLIMGVVNVTPDSFSDGGKYLDPDRAFARALQLEDQGADIIDIGGESTHPGAKRVSEQEELRRLTPVLKRLRNKLAIPVAIDTYKSAVADKALELGAEIINDPSGLTFDPQMVKIAVKHDSGLVVNHMRGTPETWAKLSPLPNVMAALRQDLEAAIRRAQLAGLDKQRIVLDPGIGFGKRGEQNYDILARLPELARIGWPILVGPSRKSFLAQKTEQGKLMASVSAVTASILAGAHIVRVHDVEEMAPAVRVADSILEAGARIPEAEPETKAPPLRGQSYRPRA